MLLTAHKVSKLIKNDALLLKLTFVAEADFWQDLTPTCPQNHQWDIQKDDDKLLGTPLITLDHQLFKLLMATDLNVII